MTLCSINKSYACQVLNFENYLLQYYELEEVPCEEQRDIRDTFEETQRSRVGSGRPSFAEDFTYGFEVDLLSASTFNLGSTTQRPERQ